MESTEFWTKSRSKKRKSCQEVSIHFEHLPFGQDGSFLYDTGMTETPTRKRQRSSSREEANVFDPASTTITAETFCIPTISRSDIDKFRSSAGKSKKQDEESSPVDVSDAIARVFEKYQAIYLPQYHTSAATNTLQWKELSGIFENLKDDDKDSFCIENETSSESFAKTDKGGSFLVATANDKRVGYCSFMVQNDKEALSSMIDKLPVTDPLQADSDQDEKWGYEPCLWVFFGRNHSDKDLDGRPEHTDQISHDGTWHYQLSGTKRWLLRPTPQLLRSWKQGDTDIEPKQMQIDCQQGDVLIVNTSLWRHQTVLPPQTEPSVSYARDFWIDPTQMNSKQGETANTEKGVMTNVDGLYAMDDIAEDTIIFREDDMPDCELHRASEENANCKVVELEDGLHAVVSCKFIKAGEFFCIPEEDSDEEEEDMLGIWEESAICKISPT